MSSEAESEYKSIDDLNIVADLLSRLFVDSKFHEFSFDSTCGVYGFKFISSNGECDSIRSTFDWWLGEENSFEHATDALLGSKGKDAFRMYEVVKLVGQICVSLQLIQSTLELTFESGTTLSLAGDRESGYNDFGWEVETSSKRGLEIGSFGGKSVFANFHSIYGGL